MEKELERLKEIIKKTKSLEDLYSKMSFFAQEVNRSYFKQESANFERPALLVSIEEGEKLVIDEDKIKMSSIRYEHYHLYEKDGIVYGHKIINHNIKTPVNPNECLLEYFNFIGTKILAYEKISDVHELNHYKNREEEILGYSKVNLSSKNRFLGEISFDHNNNSIKNQRSIDKVIKISGKEKTRIDLNNDKFDYSSCGLILFPKKKEEWSKKEDSYIYHSYNIVSFALDERNKEYIKLNSDTREILFSFDYYIKGNKEAIIKDKEKIESELAAYDEYKDYKMKRLEDYKNKK